MKKVIIVFVAFMMFGMCISCSCADNKVSDKVEAVDTTIVASPVDTVVNDADTVAVEPEDAADVAQE